MTHARKPVEPWDTDKAAQLAADALRYLGRNAPEVLENTSVLEPHEEAAHQSAMRGDQGCIPGGPQSLHESGQRRGSADSSGRSVNLYLAPSSRATVERMNT